MKETMCLLASFLYSWQWRPREEAIFHIVTQWFVRGQGGIRTAILPLSLGCRDPIINMIAGMVYKRFSISQTTGKVV